VILNYAHSRAAILCFGGWGLQVMYHLLPRLQAAQEQRVALGATTADLRRLTSMGAILADPLLNADQQAQFYVRQPRLDQALPAFTVEKLLNRIAREEARGNQGGASGLLTAAEKRAVALLHASEAMLQPLTIPGRPFYVPASGLTPQFDVAAQQTSQDRRATRRDFLHAGLLHAESLARLLETHLLDPIRQDDLVDDDPFVQTTLYVIAPLFEPLTSALIWPLVAHLMQRIGQRHVSQVVGMFATGSYATDLTRPVEDASAFAALAELEYLSGIQARQGEDQAFTALKQLVTRIAPEMAEVVGQPLFDYLYILDREKSNQGLAQDSHELAVTAANALEALVVAGGNLYVQEQLGVGMHGSEGRPYSLVGAGGDYVPITPLLQAVNRQEESRLVREWVLRNSDPALLANVDLLELRGPTLDGTTELITLELTQEKVLAQLANHLGDVLAERNPTAVDQLKVAQAFVLPQPTAQQLRRVRPTRWSDALQGHLHDLEQYLTLAVGPDFLDEAWGIRAVEPGRPWFLYDVDDRLLPAEVARMQKQLLKLLAASPMGLTLAQAQTQHWLHELDQLRSRVQSVVTPSARHLARVQRMLSLRNWELSYLQAVSTTPSFGGIMGRAGAVVLVVAIIAFLYLLYAGRSWTASDTLSLAGFAAGIGLAGVITYCVTQDRVRTLRRERIALAQRMLTAQLRDSVSDGFVRVYDRLGELLTHWNRMLAEAASELATLSTPPAMPTMPPPGIPLQPIYQPHLNERLWNRCLAYLRAQQDTQGRHSEERLGRMWGTHQWQGEMRRILSNSHGVEGQSQARTIAQFIRDTVRESVAPVSLETTNPVRQALIRELSKEYSIEHLLWRGAVEEEEFNRRLRMLELGMLPVTPMEKREGSPVRRYIEHVWHRAKPTGNYDVSDRLAIYGMTIEFVAAAGDMESELTRALLDEFNFTLLPTGNPFNILFLRSIHGLGLGDIESIRRYQNELNYLSPAERRLILLDEGLRETLYRLPLEPTPKRNPLELRYASPRASLAG